jgi:hypothetical protein
MVSPPLSTGAFHVNEVIEESALVPPTAVGGSGTVVDVPDTASDSLPSPLLTSIAVLVAVTVNLYWPPSAVTGTLMGLSSPDHVEAPPIISLSLGGVEDVR